MRRPFRWVEAGDWIAGARAAVADGPLGDADLVDLFRARYDSIIAYHAGRPADPDSFRARGVLSSSPERLFADAREIFPDVVEALLPKQELSLIDGLVAFNLDERFLLECDTFYMLYGSHFLLGLAVQLRRQTGLDAIPLLRARGVPTLLECAIPIHHLGEDTLRRLCRLSVHADLQDAPGGALPGRTDFDLTLHHPLDSRLIVRVEHPAELPDHLYGPVAAAR